MAVLTGANGAFKFRGQVMTRCRSWSLDIQKDVLEDTCLGAYDRSFIEGLRGATGSVAILYDPANSSLIDLLNRILEDAAPVDDISFVLNTRTNQALECAAIITSQSTPMTTGEAVAVSLSLQVTGPIAGSY